MGKANGKQCPVERVRLALGMTRFDLAARTDKNYSQIAHVELGYEREIPVPILKEFGPFLKDLGTTEEQLQEEFRKWRTSLSADIRRRAEKYAAVRGIYPTIDSDPTDENLHDALLAPRENGR